MDKALFEKARVNVLQKRENELQEVIHEEVREEYEHLIFESEKLLVDAASLEKINLLYKQCLKLPSIRMYDAPYIFRQANILSNYIKTRRYHPQELKELEDFVMRRRALKCRE